MLTAKASHPPARLPGASARLILTLFAVLAVILACGATTPITIKKAPASELQLAILLDNALVAGDAPVQITVRVFDLSRGGDVALSGGQRLTCGGVDDPGDEASGKPWNLAKFLVPRQPPGGAYTCVYTDESGLQTTATIPVPLAPLAFTSPTAGAHVPISAPFEPQSVATPADARCLINQVRQLVVVHYTFPVPPGYTPPLPDQPVSPRFADQEPYATVTAQAGIGSFSPPPAQCYEPSGSGLAATGTYVLSFVNTPSGVGFQQIVPGPGYIELSLAMQWLPPAGGFQAILVDTQDSVAIPIVWTTPQ